MKYLGALFATLAISLSALAQTPRGPDPREMGPYAIGHTSFGVVDTNVDPSRPQVRGIRPVGVNVWYPVDASEVNGKTPDGLYPYDPIYSLRQPLPTSPNWIASSRDWEFPCDDLPVPPVGSPDPRPLCESKAMHFPPTYEGLTPSAHAPFPLVLFSPGWNSPSVINSFFAERIASHGFVVAVVAHYRDGYIAWDTRDDFYKAMFNRPRDISFMLDALLQRNDDADQLLHNTMRADLVAAAGHSIGGYATLALAGGDDEICSGNAQTGGETDSSPRPDPCNPIADRWGNAIPTAPDPRIKALVTLDAGNPHLYFTELARIAVPSLTIGESVEGPGL